MRPNTRRLALWFGDGVAGVNTASGLSMADVMLDAMVLRLSAVVSRPRRNDERATGTGAWWVKTVDDGEGSEQGQIHRLVNFDGNRYLSRFIHRHASHFFSL